MLVGLAQPKEAKPLVPEFGAESVGKKHRVCFSPKPIVQKQCGNCISTVIPMADLPNDLVLHFKDGSHHRSGLLQKGSTSTLGEVGPQTQRKLADHKVMLKTPPNEWVKLETSRNLHLSLGSGIESQGSFNGVPNKHLFTTPHLGLTSHNGLDM